MIRSCIRQAVRGFAGAAFFSCTLAAQAGGITLNDSNCDSFSLSGPPGNQVLTCVVSNAPSGCSIQGPSTGTNNVAITLTALCSSGSPTTYAWTGGNCAGITTQSCQANGNNVTVSYGVTPSNNIGPGNTASKQVVWSASLPVKPSNCSITPTPASLPAAGGSVSLTAQCAGGDAVDTWNWGGATYTVTSGNTASATISASTTFTISPQNGGGSANGQVTVNVGGGGGGPIACTGYLNTNVVTMNWPDWVATGYMRMGPLDAAVLVFTTGATSSATTTSSGKFTATNAPAANASTTHDYTLSSVPCDFGGNATSLKTQANAGTSSIGFVIGQPTSKAPNLNTNTTYYVNIRNSSDAFSCTASGGSCDVNPASLYKPPGL